MSLDILQFGAHAPPFEAGMNQRFIVHRWFEIAD
jgi:hypothetical protein